MNKTILNIQIDEFYNKYADFEVDTFDLILNGYLKRHNFIKLDSEYFINKIQSKIAHKRIVKFFCDLILMGKNSPKAYQKMITKLKEIKGSESYFENLLIEANELFNKSEKSNLSFNEIMVSGLIETNEVAKKYLYLKDEIENILLLDDKTPLIDVNPKQTEIIIALNELGILNFLREKHPHLIMSSNRLANIIHLITGNQTENLVSNINAMYSPSQKASKNNPYNSDKVVKKVKDRLDKQLNII